MLYHTGADGPFVVREAGKYVQFIELKKKRFVPHEIPRLGRERKWLSIDPVARSGTAIHTGTILIHREDNGTLE